jgi:hypothetical protein
MTVLAPVALAFGLSVPILIVFYLLKVRRTRREVSSNLLWESLRRDLAAHEPWQRLRWTVLMVLQMILLGALTLALARPASKAPAPPSRFVALIVDTSASMRATDVAPSRFEAARDDARSIVNRLPDGATAALIEAGPTARVVVPETADRGTLLNGLDSLQAGDGATSSIDDALRIAGALARGRSDATIHLFSDGAYATPGEWDQLADLNLRDHQFGMAAGNRAITALSTRPDPQGGAPQLFARIENFDAQPARISVTLSADGKPLETRPVDLPANGAQRLFFTDLPPDARVIQVRIDQPDAFADDNEATLVRGTPSTLPVLLVTRGNLFLQKALQSLPGISVYQVSPRGYPTVDLAPYAFVVFDGYVPDQPPTKNALLINPSDSPWMPMLGIVRAPPITLWRSDDPTLAYVDLRTVKVARASNLKLPDWAHPLIESNGLPLGFVGTNNGQRTVGLDFDLQQSNLPLSAAFPIFVANVVQYLTPQSVTQNASIAPGDVAVIQPPPGVDHVLVEGPDDQRWTLPATGGAVRFTQTRRVGTYRATQFAGQQAAAVQQFAVNLFSPSESDLRPRARLADRDSAAPPAPAARQPTIHEYALWLLLLAVPLLLGEWWWFHRR